MDSQTYLLSMPDLWNFTFHFKQLEKVNTGKNHLMKILSTGTGAIAATPFTEAEAMGLSSRTLLSDSAQWPPSVRDGASVLFLLPSPSSFFHLVLFCFV